MKQIFFAIIFLYTSNLFALTTDFNHLINIADSKPGFSNDAEIQLVVFWATWCKECKKKLATTLPAWNQKSNLNIISINLDANSDRANSFLQREKIPISVFKEPNKFLEKQLKVIPVPHWAVFKKQKGENKTWKLIKHADGFDEDKILDVIQGKLS